jgi:hypothetical protein
MKPIRNFESISKWIIRFAVAAYIISLYYSDFMTFNFKSAVYLVNLAYVISALLLFIGGFQKNAVLTIIFGLFVSLISAYKVYVSYSMYGLFSPHVFLFLMLVGVGLLFASEGNS